MTIYKIAQWFSVLITSFHVGLRDLQQQNFYQVAIYLLLLVRNMRDSLWSIKVSSQIKETMIIFYIVDFIIDIIANIFVGWTCENNYNVQMLLF